MQKRHAIESKETYYRGKKRHAIEAKEAYYRGKRGLL
jgi:hypothetical protein